MSGIGVRSRGVRIAVGIAVLAVIVWRLGAGPFLDGLRAVDATVVVSALVVGVVTTVCCAYRWQTVARALDAPIRFPVAVGACYRSVFLNTALPTGVVGDVHRAVRFGRSSGDLSAGARSVAWERGAGQAVQLTLSVSVLILLPSPVRGWLPVAVAAIALVGLGLAMAVRRDLREARSRTGRLLVTARRDVRSVLDRRSLSAIVVTSAVVVAGQGLAFVIAARAAGANAEAVTLVPIALLVLAAMALPLSLAGWGPREGAAAWAFGAAGLGAATGVTAAVVYGVMSLLAALPGAALLLAEARHA